MMEERGLDRIRGEFAQAWAVFLKDVRTYYLTPPMVMWGLALPFFMFFSFSVRRGLAPQTGIARLLALTTFFTASSAGSVIFPMERRARTYDRLLVAPMAPIMILLRRGSVGAFLAVVISLISLAAGVLFFRASVADFGLLAGALVLSAEEHVKNFVALFGNFNDGSILHGKVGQDVPFESIRVMYRAFEQYGTDPLDWIGK